MKLGDVLAAIFVLAVVGLIGWGAYSVIHYERAKAAARPMVIEFNGKKYQELARSEEITIDGLRYIELWEDKK